jgi:dimethylaniline monooxygenase (N-oxide forming)
VGYWINEHLPVLSTWLTNSMFRSTMQRAWGTIEPEYRLQPDLRYAGNPVTLLINDDLVPALRDGRVRSAYGIRRVVGAKRVEMEDGSVLEDIDAIVACTGYHTSFDLLGDAMTFKHTTATGRDALKVPPQPDLYQNVFSLSYPDSLACLNYIAIPENTAGCSELASMAIAQVWSGKTCLPPLAEMRREVSFHQSWFERRCLREPVTQLPGMVRGGPWLEFVHRAAGTGLYENLSCWTWPDKVEDQHAAHTDDELAEAALRPDFDEERFIAAGREMLDGVQAFWVGLDEMRRASA